MQFSVEANMIKKLILNISSGSSKDKNSVLSNYLVSVKNGATHTIAICCSVFPF